MNEIQLKAKLGYETQHVCRSHFEKLPEELILGIFQLLTTTSSALINLSLTCKLFNRISKDETLDFSLKKLLKCKKTFIDESQKGYFTALNISNGKLAFAIAQVSKFHKKYARLKVYDLESDKIINYKKRISGIIDFLGFSDNQIITSGYPYYYSVYRITQKKIINTFNVKLLAHNKENTKLIHSSIDEGRIALTHEPSMIIDIFKGSERLAQIHNNRDDPEKICKALNLLGNKLLALYEYSIKNMGRQYYLWSSSLKTGKTQTRFFQHQPITFTSNKKLVAVAFRCFIEVLDRKTLNTVFTYSCLSSYESYKKLIIHKNMLVTNTGRGYRIWNLAQNKELYKYEKAPSRICDIQCVDDSNGKVYIISQPYLCQGKHYIEIFDVAKKKIREVFLDGHPKIFHAVINQGKKNCLAVELNDGRIQFWSF